MNLLFRSFDVPIFHEAGNVGLPSADELMKLTERFSSLSSASPHEMRVVPREVKQFVLAVHQMRTSRDITLDRRHDTMMPRKRRIAASILATIGALGALFISSAMAFALWDGPPEGELRGYQQICSTCAFVGSLLTLVLILAMYQEWKRVWVYTAGLLFVNAVIFLMGAVMFDIAAPKITLRGIFTAPLPAVIWIIAASISILYFLPQDETEVQDASVHEELLPSEEAAA